MRIVFNTFGTLGDLHPMLALATELRRRGHDCVFAVPEVFRLVLDPLNFRVYPLPPNLDPNDAARAADLMDLRRGTERLLREVLFPVLPETVRRLRAAVEDEGGADLLISSDLAYAAPIVAELTGIRWASVALAPLSFFSRYDPPALLHFPGLAWIEQRVPAVNRAVMPIARWYARNWPQPVYELRTSLGLPRGPSPLFDAKNSPQLVLALFSSLLSAPQQDWPAHTRICGFPLYDGRQPGGPQASELPAGRLAEADSRSAGALDVSANSAIPSSTLPPHVEKFLEMGEPPVVFTLGSSAVFAAGDFYAISKQAAAKLGVRAILLTGVLPDGQPRGILSPDLCTAEYVSYAELFPRVAAIVHQGGIGTIAHALKNGKPMIIMPCSHDQPDNARRCVRLGISRTVPREKYTAERAAAELHALLRDPFTAPRYATATQLAARRVEKENGTQTACDALESLLEKEAPIRK